MTLPLTIEYFQFEEDFMEDNIRCIPMIVRFKLDACGIKLKLKEWSKMDTEERTLLADHSIESNEELNLYRHYLTQLIVQHTGNEPTTLPVDANPEWLQMGSLPKPLSEKLNELHVSLSLEQWQQLNTLQRFALMKLTRPGHENRNFPRAMKEFGLI